MSDEAERQDSSKCKRCLQNVGEGSVICIKTIKLKTNYNKFVLVTALSCERRIKRDESCDVSFRV